MDGSKKKNKKVIKFDDFVGIAGFLKELTTYFEGGGNQNDLETLPPLEDFYQVELTIKVKEGKCQVKYKTKELDLEVVKQKSKRAESKDETKPSYKTVKKRMKVSFRVIKTALLDKKCPEESVIREFLADSRIMVSYPGYGDEYYNTYINACNNFEVAFSEGNIEKMGLVFLTLDKLRQDCHDRHL